MLFSVWVKETLISMGNSNFPASKLIKYWHEVTADSTAYHGKSISSHLIFLVKSFRIINEIEAGKTNSCPLCTGRWAPPHPLFKASNTLGCFIESPWPLPSRALRFDLYLCRFGWENEDLKMGKSFKKTWTFSCDKNERCQHQVKG